MALVVFTGGARSGKSAAAQRLALARELDGARVCVVVFGRHAADDPEFAARIGHHRSSRPASWTTIEATGSQDWLDDVESDVLLLVDCAGTLVGLAMEEAFGHLTQDDFVSGEVALRAAPSDALPPGYEQAVRDRVGSALDALLARTGDAIVVTNEVGDGPVPVHASGRLFRDVMGQVNRRLVAAADGAYLCVAGRLVSLSALPSSVAWPED